ncbi:MAG: CinA family protein [Treponema sp.]|jgi:PncC family amidohydrolase|nr:CinA family protein [Treponema sp.]
MVSLKAKKLVQRLTALNKSVAAAESCTAGMAASLIAGIPGASRVLWGSYVSYTPEAKIMMLGVGNEILDQFGAVSKECACAMAQGALEKSGADFAFSVTGLAGPGGDETGNAAGTVWIAAARQGEKAQATLYHFTGSRNRIRRKAAEKALDVILKKLLV